MRFVPKPNVRNRLTLAFLLVIVLSWFANVVTIRYFMEQDFKRIRRELAARGISPDQFRHFPGDHGDRRSPLDRIPMRAIVRPRLWPRALPVQAGFALLISLAAGAWLARRFTRPLLQLESGAHAFHERAFDHRIPEQGDDEFSRVAASMNEMAQRVEAQISALEADASRRQHLLADVAHELRSPVATLKTMAEAMRDGLADQPQRREKALTTMVAMADRMQRLVNDLLELTKLDLRELPLHRRNVDLAEIAGESVAMHMEDAERAGIQLRPFSTDAPAAVYGDPQRLAEIVDNLLDNAIDHAGRGAEVTVSVCSDDRVRVVVADTGRGIAKEHLPFVFDPFFRVDAARTPGDLHSGLGLRIARGLAEAHDGELSLESEEGHGVRVTVTLPPANGSRPAT